MHCINISHPDYLALEQSAGIHPSALKAMISVWMDKNGSDKFPSLEELKIVKPGVQELFESNPELANAVYEALGFKEYSKETKNKLALTERLKDIFKDKSTVLFRAGDNTDAFYIDLVKTSDDRYFYFSEGQSPEEISKERFAEEIEFIDGQVATTKEKDAFIKNFLDIADLNQISENPLLTKEKKIEAQKDILKKVTPQQKQQAQQLYSQYLDTKQADVILPTDKIIWGHPAIGKSYAAKKVKMIDFDSYKLGINRKYNLYIAPGLSDTELRTDDKTREARENWRYESEENQALWNQFIRDSWQQAKKDAKEQGAILFASDLLVLREFGNEVDKALTMPNELFFERSKQRNNFIEGELGTKVWKGNLNKAVENFKEKFGDKKVINTEKYLSDLFLGSKQDIEEFKEFVENKGNKPSDVLYQKPSLNYYQELAKDIYFNSVWGQDLSDSDVARINQELQKISRQIGDTDWSLRKSKNDKYYIAGYKNGMVTSQDYYSPYANGLFRQLESTAKEGPIQELTDKLYAWAKTHGIAIEAMDTLMERFAERYQDGALGVADFANALIGIADGAKIDTLPEEIAHFAIEIMINDPSVIRALEAVKLTPQYAAVKEAYKDTYNNEIDFQKEALGKLLAQALISEFKTPTDITKEEQGFWAYLKSVKDRFVNWVKSKFSKSEAARQDLDNAILPLAKAILDGQYLGELIEENYMPEGAQKMMYSLEDNPEPEPVPDPIIENKKKFVQEVIIQLGDRMSMLKRSAKSQVSIAAIEKEIQLLEYKLAKGELDLAISSFVKLAEGEIDMIYTALKKAQNSGLPNPTTLVLSENFMQMYENIFRNFLKEMYDAKAPLEETEELRKLIHNLSITIQDARGINQVLMKNISRRVLEEANTDPYGNIIDPDFDAGAVSEDTHEDVSTWRLLVGNYKYADSKIIKAAHKIIFDSIAVVKRFATRTGNDLLSAQETMLKSGGKIEDLIEKNEDGSNSHYFIREYKWADYYKKMEEAKQKIAEELGFENYNQIQIVFLNPDQLKVYTTGWKNFYNENTKKFSYQNESGDVVTKKVPNDSYRNARFDEVMSNPATKAYYDLLIKTKKQALDKMPVQYRTEKMIFMVPPILKSTIDRLTNKDESFITRVSKLAREALFIEQDETQFGQLNVLNNKMVPIHFIRPLSNISDLSYDVARSVTLFAEMAENFREMNKISGDLGTLQYTLAERNYFTDNKRTQRKKGIESKEYEALEVLLDAHVFGIERKALASEPLPENKITKALGIDGKQFSWTKASQRFATFIRNNNLAFNFITSTSGWLKGSGDSVIEDAIGIYTTQESKMWARGEFFSNLFQVIGEVGKPKQTNKMHLILQEAGVVELEKMLYETTKNRATRKLLNRDIMYTTFATGDYGIKGRITLAIYDNYRLYNNQFMTRARFYEKTAKEKGVENDGKHQKEVSKQWSELREKSLYNAHDVVDGKLIIKPEYEKYATENLLNSVKGKVESVATYVDGTMSKTDKGKLARTIAGDFLLMHRGWFIGLVDTRFRKEGTNLITEEEEIGTYRATSSFLYTAFYKTLIKDKAGLSAAFGTWNTLSPAKKRGVMKTGLDLLYLTLVSFVSALANIAADDADDDDWTTQYMAYQLNRLLLEQGAAWSPAELVNMIDEPVVGARMIKDLLDLGEMFNFHDVYESGMYEDKYHATKWWMKKLPTRNIYEMQFPELKNRFIKQMVDSKIYEAMSDDQAKSVTGSSWFKDWILPKGVLSDSDTQKENIQYIMNDLEEDSEEDNGFN